MFNKLNFDCLALIAEFAGTRDGWKHRFSIDVLPCLEKGWKLVGSYNNEPCINCYWYEDDTYDFYETNGLCHNCMNQSNLVLTNFYEMCDRSCGSLLYLERYQDVKSYLNVCRYISFFVTEEAIRLSHVFQRLITTYD
jgi:hypothetical protein